MSFLSQPKISFSLAARHVVIGLGPTGLSIIKTLHHLGVTQLYAMDSRTHPPQWEQAQRLCDQFVVGGFSTSLLEQADHIWISPGVAVATPIFAPYLHKLVGGDIELYAQLTQVPVLAITGTNGKSTVTTLLGEMCVQAGRDTVVGGNLGEPALELWLAHEAQGHIPDIAVLELSSFQLETTYSLQPLASVILNIEPDHLDRYHSFEEYAETKARIYKHTQSCIGNRDDPRVMHYQAQYTSTLSFGLTAQADFGVQTIQGELWLSHQQQPWLAAKALKITGLHNIANALAASAVAYAAQLPQRAICHALCAFTGLPHRAVLIREWRGVQWIDDSKGTNVAASIATIKGTQAPKWLILGGDGKGQDFEPLNAAMDLQIRGVLLIGQAGEQIAQVLASKAAECGFGLHYTGTLAIAVAHIAEHAQAGDVVLLSPACASYGQFKDYIERGQVFSQLVERLP